MTYLDVTVSSNIQNYTGTISTGVFGPRDKENRVFSGSVITRFATESGTICEEEATSSCGMLLLCVCVCMCVRVRLCVFAE